MVASRRKRASESIATPQENADGYALAFCPHHLQRQRTAQAEIEQAEIADDRPNEREHAEAAYAERGDQYGIVMNATARGAPNPIRLKTVFRRIISGA